LNPLQQEVEVIVAGARRVDQLKASYEGDCRSLEKDVLLVDQMLANRPEMQTYLWADAALRQLSGEKTVILSTFASATRA
jgi:hypothetical protein